MTLLSETNPVYMISASDLKDIIIEIISETLAKHQAENDDRLIPANQAKVMLSIDRSTLWRWEKEHYLLPVRVGGKVFYRLSDIDAIKGARNGHILGGTIFNGFSDGQ